LTNISEVDRDISVYAEQRIDMAARLFDEFHDAYLAHEVVFDEKASQVKSDNICYRDSKERQLGTSGRSRLKQQRYLFLTWGYVRMAPSE
jgi:hypothetical protein